MNKDTKDLIPLHVTRCCNDQCQITALCSRFKQRTIDSVKGRTHMLVKDFQTTNPVGLCEFFMGLNETLPTPKKDNINPNHYKKGKVECIDAIESATIGKVGIESVCTANVIKYLWRYEDKNGLEDVKKAKWYLEKLIDYLENY